MSHRTEGRFPIPKPICSTDLIGGKAENKLKFPKIPVSGEWDLAKGEDKSGGAGAARLGASAFNCVQGEGLPTLKDATSIARGFGIGKLPGDRPNAYVPPQPTPSPTNNNPPPKPSGSDNNNNPTSPPPSGGNDKSNGGNDGGSSDGGSSP